MIILHPKINHVPDMEAFQALMGTRAGAEAMAHDGVLPESHVVLVEDGGRGEHRTLNAQY